MSNEHEIEIKCVFGLLDPANTREIHVQQVNNLVESLESFSPIRKRSKTVEKQEEVSVAKARAKPVKEVEKRNTNFVITSQKSYNKRNSIRKAPNELLTATEGNDRSALKTSENTKPQEVEPVAQVLETQEKERVEFSLKAFPNKKKSMNYDEFSDLYLDVFTNNAIQEDLLLKCFSIFDYEKQGYLTAKAVQKVFEVFNEKISEDDVENLLKFVGCTGERMTFNEFKDFFKKNL